MHEIIDYTVRCDGLTDPWGDAIGPLGSLCDALTVLGHGTRIPAEVGYRPAMGLTYDAVFDPSVDYATSDDYGETQSFICALNPSAHPGIWVEGTEALTVDDMVHAVHVLHRYLNVVKLAGRDY